MSGMGGIVEFSLVALFALGWMVLEWQGRRLDRKRADREAMGIGPGRLDAPTSAACGTAALPERSACGNDRATGSHE